MAQYEAVVVIDDIKKFENGGYVNKTKLTPRASDDKDVCPMNVIFLI